MVFGTLVLFTGSLADRLNRRFLLGTCALLWSGTSIATAYSNTFVMICIFRMLLGLFESATAPSAYSLIADYFPPETRTTANAYFAGCIFVGTALSSVSTVMVGNLGWSLTYLIVGIYGCFAAMLVLIFIQEPPRGRYDVAKV